MASVAAAIGNVQDIAAGMGLAYEKDTRQWRVGRSGRWRGPATDRRGAATQGAGGG